MRNNCRTDLRIQPNCTYSPVRASCPSWVDRAGAAQAPSGPEAVELVGLGCCGYVSHDLAAADLVSAVRHAAAGRSPLDSVAAAAIVHQWRAATAVAHAELQLSHRELSRRETEILDGMAQGMSVPALAHSFGLSRKTVESHKSRIFSKLGARTQAQAIKIAVADGLVLRSAAPP